MLLRLCALAGATVILCWPAPEAAERAAVPASAADVLYSAIVDRSADGDASNNVGVGSRDHCAEPWADQRRD